MQIHKYIHTYIHTYQFIDFWCFHCNYQYLHITLCLRRSKRHHVLRPSVRPSVNTYFASRDFCLLISGGIV